MAAIVLVMAAALLPIIGEIFKPDGKPPIWLSPGWASVALVLAATLLVLDRFYGCSSSWMRFMATEMQIREALHVFRMDFQILRTDWPGGKPSEKQVREGLERCRGFLAQLDGLLRAELDAWVQEFRTSLKDIDEMVKLRSEVAKAAVNTAAINMMVENGDKCEHGWTLSVDGGIAQACRGQTAAVAGLLPGIHFVKIVARIGGREVAAEKSVNVAAGATPEVRMMLA